MQRASASGTSLKGYITDISYDQLVSVLGEPDGDGDGYKVDVEWEKEDRGVIFTVYNWKNGPNYNDGRGDAKAIRTWHIGGHSIRAVDAVQRLFPFATVQPAGW